ncbi:MAG TPA: transporter substrate-binding domain-containing protein [Trinickia sp.]|uniref:substrate-binding periplasmic protein n=1 Tax=Trinickia sp. TaxID=2571163 RepID=UPI002CD192F5|nr:transporter substrate-binding domain-containing protein [Trinickia sp.]HTI16079.1 transporter substrate-binding domain-containing protein [Trinickia sp.]
MKRLLLQSLGFVALMCAANLCRAGLPPVIAVCDDAAEWPPYTYYDRTNGETTHALTGFSVEYLQRVLANKGLRFSLELLPWKRCMAEVQEGHYAMILNASNNEERARTFLVSRPYYTLTLVYFYDAQRPRPTVKSATDLRALQLCGVRGYNYAPFALQPDMIDTDAKDLPQALHKLKHGGCDVVPDRLEIVLGYQLLGVINLQQAGIRYAPVPGLPRSPFSMLVSRNVPYAAELLAVLNDGIAEIESRRGASDLAAKYGLPQEGLPKR